nr:hypothetical protein [Tanacetum cinerariifolium]
ESEPGPEYSEYLPPADDMLLAEEQPLPAAVSPTAKSPGYITESEPEMEPEENDGDDERSEGDSIDYPTSRGDNDANDDGGDLSKDDADDEDEEESSDSEEEEEKHQAPTVPALALDEDDHQYSIRSQDNDDDDDDPSNLDETGIDCFHLDYYLTIRLTPERGDIFAPWLPLMQRRMLTPVIIVLGSWTTVSHERFIPEHY